MLVMKLNEVIAGFFAWRTHSEFLSNGIGVFSLLPGKEVTVFVNMLVP